MTTATKIHDHANVATLLPYFVGPAQLTVLYRNTYGEEGPHFRQLMTDLADRLAAMPATYEQDGLGQNAVAHLHYFKGGADWYITEKDMEEEQLQAFGVANLGHGPEMGYIRLDEITRAGVEIDLYWQPKPLHEIPHASR